MGDKLERRFTSEQLSRVILRAEALRCLEDEREAQRIKELANGYGGTISLADAYDVVKQVGIPEKYFRRSLKEELSPEEQLRDLRRYNVVPSASSLVELYGEELRQALIRSYPLMEFAVKLKDLYSNSDLNFYGFEKRKFERMRGKKRKKLARLHVSNRGTNIQNALRKNKLDLDLEIFDPIFLNACGERFEELNEFFSEYIGNVSRAHQYVEPLRNMVS